MFTSQTLYTEYAGPISWLSTKEALPGLPHHLPKPPKSNYLLLIMQLIKMHFS